jgi:hypothetical protein
MVMMTALLVLVVVSRGVPTGRTSSKLVHLVRSFVTSRQGRSPDLGYVDFRMTKH